MVTQILLTAPILFAVAAGPAGSAETASSAETVVLRTTSGRFLRTSENGTVEAAGLYPGDAHRFELLVLDDDHVAIRASTGRFLIARESGGRRVFAAGAETAPGVAESFRLVPVEGNLVGLEAPSSGKLVFFDTNPPKAPVDAPPEGPQPGETVEIFRCQEIPDALQTALGSAIQGGIQRELGDKEYSKITTHDRDRYITLPVPTLRDPGRKKRHQVLGVPEEYHLRARLAAEPEIHITRMPCLTGYRDARSTSILLAAEIRLPVRGHVSYKVPKLLSATTGYEATVVVKLVGQLPISKDGDRISLGAPELPLLDVALERLDLSNDILHTLRHPIERTINGELRENNPRIRAEVNNRLASAAEGKEFHNPLLRFLIP